MHIASPIEHSESIGISLLKRGLPEKKAIPIDQQIEISKDSSQLKATNQNVSYNNCDTKISASQ